MANSVKSFGEVEMAILVGVEEIRGMIKGIKGGDKRRAPPGSLRF